MNGIVDRILSAKYEEFKAVEMDCCASPSPC
jgi:hypothetical protein